MKKPHKKLDAWKLSMELAGLIYWLTSKLPGDEKFGLVTQMRRSSVSVASNIAEGAARDSKAQFRQFVSIARSSLSELDTQVDVCELLEYLDGDSIRRVGSLMDRLDKLLYGLHRFLRA